MRFGARVGELKGEVLDLRGRSIQYNILQREVDTNRSLYDALLQRYKEIGVAGGVGTAPVSIVDRADAPTFPYKPNLFMNLLMGLGAGLLAGLAGAVGLEFVSDTIKTREDVRNKLRLPCLGAVPKTAARDTFIEDLKNPASVVSEAYSAIVAALRFSTEAGMPKILLVTSTQSGEGKSSTALALAQNFARREKSVLLVDADLRKPAFKAATDKVGLSKLLTTDDPIRDHVLETQHSNFWLLPSGPVPPNPADLLSTGRIRKIIAEADEQFDLIVIDGPPTLGSRQFAAPCRGRGQRAVRRRKRKDSDAGGDRGFEPSRGDRHARARRDADQSVVQRRLRLQPLRLWLRLCLWPAAAECRQEADRDPNDPSGNRIIPSGSGH